MQPRAQGKKCLSSACVAICLQCVSQTLEVEAGKMLMVKLLETCGCVYHPFEKVAVPAVSLCCGETLILKGQIFAEALHRFENVFLA